MIPCSISQSQHTIDFVYSKENTHVLVKIKVQIMVVFDSCLLVYLDHILVWRNRHSLCDTSCCCVGGLELKATRILGRVLACTSKEDAVVEDDQ